MYRDMWDQKPPGIAFVYAGLVAVSPREAIVPAADLLCATAVALMLVAIGRLRYSPAIGYAAAAAYLLLGDPYLQRLSGVYLRAQCEPFINVAVCGAMLLLALPSRNRIRLLSAGVALGAAFWLKYNAAAYALPLGAALWAWRSESEPSAVLIREAAWIAGGFAVVCGAFIAYFAVHGALHDLYLASVLYNLGYSNETYRGPASVLVYLATFPLERARVDFLWFLGGLGAILLVTRVKDGRSSVVLTWLMASSLSIAINGSRDLPNYFVQALPPLALSASAGLATLVRSPVWLRSAVTALVLAGLWRIGPDETLLGMRWASLPGLVENVRFDLQYARGGMTRDEYLHRFKGKKFDAFENESLVHYIDQVTQPAGQVFVFGFSGGTVGWKSRRTSPSRFFWSMPVIREFAGEEPGYGSAGLLDELKRSPPEIVALQNDDWKSRDVFLGRDSLRQWLEQGYRLDHTTPMFSVWRKR